MAAFDDGGAGRHHRAVNNDSDTAAFNAFKLKCHRKGQSVRCCRSKSSKRHAGVAAGGFAIIGKSLSPQPDGRINLTD